MTSSTTSMDGRQRPRLRRSIVGIVAAGAFAAPFALAPTASAQTGGNPLGGIEQTLLQTITSLPNTLTHPLGGSSGDLPPGDDACADPALISPFLSCIIDTLADVLGGQSATTTKVTVRKKVRSVRKHARVHKVHR